MSITYRFPKSIRLRQRAQYQRMSAHTFHQSGQWILIDSRDNTLGTTRLGITTTRRYGKAHDRNRFKRLVREAFRLSYPDLKQGIDLNIKPRPSAKHASMADIQKDLLFFLRSHESKSHLMTYST